MPDAVLAAQAFLNMCNAIYFADRVVANEAVTRWCAENGVDKKGAEQRRREQGGPGGRKKAVEDSPHTAHAGLSKHRHATPFADLAGPWHALAPHRAGLTVVPGPCAR